MNEPLGHRAGEAEVTIFSELECPGEGKPGARSSFFRSADAARERPDVSRAPCFFAAMFFRGHVFSRPCFFAAMFSPPLRANGPSRWTALMDLMRSLSPPASSGSTEELGFGLKRRRRVQFRMSERVVARLGLPERVLYHQVHPLKLATDFSTAIASLLLLGRHRLGLALLVMWIPSVLVSIALIRRCDFSRTRDAAVGAYLRRYMTRNMETVRFLGLGAAAVGAWHHVTWLIVLGAALVASGWFGPWLLGRSRAR